MVKDITAFQADDGSIHETRLAALEHDAVERLKKLQCFNHASALEIVRRAEEVASVLSPIVTERLPVAAACEQLASPLASETIHHG